MIHVERYTVLILSIAWTPVGKVRLQALTQNPV